MISISPNSVSVVIVAYNEASVIAGIVAEVKQTGHRVLVVDDGSEDVTAELAAAAGAIVIKHPINLGQGAAIQSGIDYALWEGAEFIVTFDGDGQHDPANIASLLKALAMTSADFALGSRFMGKVQNLPPLRKLLLKVAIWFTRATTRMNLTDTHNGLRAMTRVGATKVQLRQNRMAHASEILAQIATSGLPYVEVPVTISYSEYSLMKGQKLTGALEILVDLFVRRLYR
jgi:polyprenyl-phospho-N-acetylgalactosaminyl synthase